MIGATRLLGKEVAFKVLPPHHERDWNQMLVASRFGF